MLINLVPEDAFGQRRTANVSQANEKYFHRVMAKEKVPEFRDFDVSLIWKD